MELYTRIDIPKDILTFTYDDRIMLLGSCFTENIGRHLDENKFRVDINPFGTLYNPASVARAIRSLIQPEKYTSKEMFEHNGVYHSFTHHSRFSSASETEALEGINKRLEDSAEELKKITRLVVTFGSAYAYRLKSNGQIVANCHKLPDKMFTRERLSVDEIVKEWKELLLSLWEHNPKTKVMLTVSPIRHWKDGAHGNQLSKSTLLLAADYLKEEFPGQVDYFPAYEIMMDELRDYRYYADDMVHPSSLAIEYIWQRFTESCLTKDTQSILKEWNEIIKAINHKPFQPDSEAYSRFIHQTLLKMEQLHEKMPFFDMEKEREELITNYQLRITN